MTAIAISLVSLAVAAFSFTVASERFRLDLYSKRFDIYIRTVRFYQVVMKSPDTKGDAFIALRNDFILGCRESQFLFSPESGIHKKLNDLNGDSFIITGRDEMPKDLPAEQKMANQTRYSQAMLNWNSSMEPLEVMMAPYLSYHYTSLPMALAAKIRKVMGGS